MAMSGKIRCLPLPEDIMSALRDENGPNLLAIAQIANGGKVRHASNVYVPTREQATDAKRFMKTFENNFDVSRRRQALTSGKPLPMHVRPRL